MPDSALDRPPRSTVWRWVWFGLLAAVLVATGWVGWRGWQAVDGLTDAKTAASAINAGLATGALPSASDVSTAQQGAARAVAATSDPLFRAATHLPWIGPQLGAVRAVALSVDQVASQVVPPLVSMVDSMGSLRTTTGEFDLSLISDQAEAVTAADAAAVAAADRVDGLGTEGLLPSVADAVEQASEKLDDVAATTHQIGIITNLLPGMLGADGPRTYLVLALNNAELRPAGGIVGSAIELSVNHGHLTFGRQISASSLATLAEPVVPLTAEETAIDGARLGRYLQNASLTPDFPRTAELAVARWQAETGGQVDGVVAVDAPAVAALLDAVGPVPSLDGGELTGADFVASVLRDPYLAEVDQDDTDEKFAQVAAAVFVGLLSSDLDGPAVVEAVRDIVGQQRLRVWSADPSEEDLLATTTVGGAFLSGPFEHDAGLFLTDLTGGKLDYYLTTTTQVHRTADGASAELTVSYDPPDGVESSSIYLRGPASSNRAPGDAAIIVSVYPTVGGEVTQVLVNGRRIDTEAVARSGRDGLRFPVVLAPGEQATVQVTLVGDEMTGLWTTPTVGSGGVLGLD